MCSCKKKVETAPEVKQNVIDVKKPISPQQIKLDGLEVSVVK